MKTTKKGFTLIELIVVIAIVGVLAAILVPAMIGYVRKSKITTANEAALTIMKAATTALVSLEEENVVFDGTIQFDHGAMEGFSNPSEPEASRDCLFSYMTVYSEDVYKTAFSLCLCRGICVAVGAGKSNFYGTVPQLYTTKTYNTYAPTSTRDALADAVNKYDMQCPGILDLNQVVHRDVRNLNNSNNNNNGNDNNGNGNSTP